MKHYLRCFFHVPGVCVLIILSMASIAAFSAQEDDSVPDIHTLNRQLDAQALDAKQYVDAVDQWLNIQFASGIKYERDTLIKLLANFRTIAWSADSLVAKRINYYINLSNNANYANREGESVYFLEKAEQEVLSAYGEKPLMVAGRKSNTYIDKGNYRNVIATYEKEKAYIEQFPELIRSEKINLNIAISFINVLNPTIQAYAKLRDTVHLYETLALAEAIHAELKKRIKPTNNSAFITNFYVQQLYYHRYFTLEGNKEKSREALQAVQHALYGDTTKPASLIGQLEPVLVTKQIEYFLKYNENDSATYYLARLKAMPGVFTDHDFTLNRFEAELLANRGQYEQAYGYVYQALVNIDSIQSILVDDIDELLYAHTDAEYNRIALAAAEQAKRQRMLWLIAVAVLATGVIASIYFLMVRKEKKAKGLIEKLNAAANIQIASMEEIKQQAILEEQQRLARELHDGLSATFAGIKHQLEVCLIDAQHTPVEGRLAEIRNQVDHAYTIARDKSHQWYSASSGLSETNFKNRIQTLLDSALPDSRYHKEIHIDDDVLRDVPTETRIELLRIIQEAVTNIIKHAKATRVAVLIYQDSDYLVLSIRDNGRGFTRQQHSVARGLGLPSIQQRVAGMGGSVAVNNGSSGVELLINIPQPLNAFYLGHNNEITT